MGLLIQAMIIKNNTRTASKTSNGKRKMANLFKKTNGKEKTVAQMNAK